jgi:fermentation-respiration switch protein FrsA (DUF1100 family)
MPSSNEKRSLLDRPEILRFIFYPRIEDDPTPRTPGATNVWVPVGDDVTIGCRFYHAQEKGPSILFFHGNGEIVSDYDFIAPLYVDRGINLFVADYRGYGFSGGTPTTTCMIEDAHLIFQHFMEFLEKNRYVGPVFVMGRSLGSAPALELGLRNQNHMAGVIIESGFADTIDLLKSLGIPIVGLEGDEGDAFSNLEKMRGILLRTLIIHAERDHLIPVHHARDLYAASPAQDKRLVIIPDANHNDLLMVGSDIYFRAVTDFVSAQGGQG